jgi:titin
MKRLTGAVSAFLLAVTLWFTPMTAQAAGAAAPDITSPTDGEVINAGPLEAEVDFTDALPGGYTVTLRNAGGTLIGSVAYDFDGSNPQAAVELGRVRQPGAYTLRVIDAGGTVVETSQFSAIARPGAPSGVIAEPASEAATLSWQPPASDGGSPITGYQVQLETSAASRQEVPATARSYVFSDLINGTTYRLYVRAQNAAGNSPWASVLTTPFPPATRPATPAMTRVDAASRRATLRWTYTSGDNGGAPLIRYQVQRGTTAATRQNLSPTTRAKTFRRLTNGRRYTFYVRAQNRIGSSPWVGVSATPARRPYAPARTRATVSSQRARLYWGYAAGGNGGAAITAYQVQRGSSIETRTTRSRTARSHPFSGLTNGATYRLYVRARNRVGYGPWARATARP